MRWLLLVLILVATAHAAIPSSALIDWSFVNCQTDPICAQALPSGNDPDLFAEMLLEYVSTRHDIGIGILDIVTPCAQPITTPNCTAILALWIGMLREARLCEINEEWIAGQCRCIEGFNCYEDCIAERALDITALTIISIAFLVAVVAGFAWVLWAMRQTNERVSKVETRENYMNAVIGAVLFAREEKQKPDEQSLLMVSPEDDRL